MADYYPLIARAVAGLEKNSGENRRALYERARGALLAQLRSVTPALNESDITRERLALEESIRKVEAESARKFTESVRQPPAPRVRPVEPRSREEAPGDSPPPGPAAVAPAESAQESRLDGVRRPRPPLPSLKPLASSPAPPRAAVAEKRHPDPDFDPEHSPPSRAAQPALPLRRPTPERPPVGEGAGAGRELRNAVPQRNDLAEPGKRSERFPRDTYPPPPIAEINRAQRLRDRAEDRVQDNARDRGFDRVPDNQKDQVRDGTRDRVQDRAPFDRSEARIPEPQPTPHETFEPHREAYQHNDFSEPMLESSFVLDDAHPVSGKVRHVSTPPEEESWSERATARAREWLAWRPSRELLKVVSAAGAALLVLAFLAWEWPRMVDLYRGIRAAPVETARETPAPAATRSKTTDRIEPGTQTASAPVPGTQPTAAVAQKVVLYEEDPADPNGKRFVGSAIWRTETVNPGPGQPPELAIRADVEVPERKLAMTWSLRRNTDKALPASHTVEIIFKLPTDFPSGGISNVPGILMKQGEQQRGVPLAGLAVKVTSGFFLIGLSSVDTDKERNLQLLKDRTWFDIPVVYNNNRRAILAMEKGTPGERAFGEAFKVWKQ
jgi:hypothetical protein